MRRLTREDVGNIWLGIGVLGVMASAGLRVNFRDVDAFLGAVMPLVLGGIGAVFLWKAVGRLVC